MTVAIIVTYESEGVLGPCVQSALSSGIDRIVIWDNSPSNSTAAFVAELGDSRITLHSDGDNHGFGGGVNRAVAIAGVDEDLLLLNPDCVLNIDALRLLEKYRVNDASSIFAPRMLYQDGSFGISGGPSPSLLKEILAFTRLDDLLPRAIRLRVLRLFKPKSKEGGSLADSLTSGLALRMDWVSGFCIFLTGSTFQKVGGFDETYFLYFEDVDFCRRAAALGIDAVLVREAAVLHYESTSTGPRNKSAFYMDGMARYFLIHGSWVESTLAKWWTKRT